MSSLTFPASPRALPQAFIDAISDYFGPRFATQFSTTPAVREHHGRDESLFDPLPPDGVVFAQSTEDVAAVVRLCAQHRVPLIPYGSGSSLEGHLLAVQGGLSLDVSQMNAVLAINAEDLTATVQAGVTRKQLNETIKHSGLFFPIDPGADATLGGMSATRASGTNAVRYGTMRENVVALQVVTAEGKIIRTARRAKKSSAGYDLTRMFVGSEGTLGVITEVTVKLYAQPEAVSAAICNFPDVDAAVRCVIETIQIGVPLARVELLDATCVKVVNAYSKMRMKETPLLLFEFHGSNASVREQAGLVQQVANEHGGIDFEWADQPEDRTRLWQARHNTLFAALQIRPGSRALNTDVCVPISRLAESIATTVQDLATVSWPALIVGHVGDGNYHVVMLIEPGNDAELAEAEGINQRLVSRAIQMDGTCSGEHGIGLHKMRFMREEHGEDALDLMRRLKQAFDPLNILNPGKILPL